MSIFIKSIVTDKQSQFTECKPPAVSNLSDSLNEIV